MQKIHEDRDYFAEALNFTAATTRFSARLLEKDYYCTLLLGHLASQPGGLVFKGGTCLAKVHAEFFRLSEDLDFAIPAALASTRKSRQTLAAPMKEAFARLTRALPCFHVGQPLVGANNSTQYVGSLTYHSLISGQDEPVKVEVALREPLLTPAVSGSVRTALLNPLTRRSLVPSLSMPCLSREEAFAEKFRAAMSRREIAIRDFFDLDYAVRKLGLDPDAPGFADLVRQKLAVPGNAPVDVSASRLAALRRQMGPQLQPVLRPNDFAEFDVDRAFGIVADMAARVSEM